MKLTAEQIQENWDQLLNNINQYISSPRKEKLLAFYKKYEDRLILMPAAHKHVLPEANDFDRASHQRD